MLFQNAEKDLHDALCIMHNSFNVGFIIHKVSYPFFLLMAGILKINAISSFLFFR